MMGLWRIRIVWAKDFGKGSRNGAAATVEPVGGGAQGISSGGEGNSEDGWGLTEGGRGLRRIRKWERRLKLQSGVNRVLTLLTE